MPELPSQAAGLSSTGGGVFTGQQLGALVLRGASRLTGNTAGGHGGALAAMGGVDGIALGNRSRVAGNRCNQSGGAIHVGAGAVGMIMIDGGSSFSANAAGDKGGALGVGSGGIGRLVITNSSSVESNSGVSRGGAVWCNGPMGLLLLHGNSSLSYNSVSANSSMGGAISVNGRVESVVLQGGSLLANNSADRWGGALDVGGVLKSLVVNDSAVYGNHGGLGGVLNVDEELGLVLLGGGASMSHNQAVVGISGRGGNGGAVNAFGRVGNITIDQQATVEGNFAALWGGVFACWNGLESLAVRDGGSLHGNSASGEGGAVGVATGGIGTLLLAGGRMTYNTAAEEGGAVWCNGTLQQMLLDSNSLVSSNRVTANNSMGGAVSVRGNVSSITIRGGSVLTNNSADRRGGAVVVSPGSLGSLVVDGATVFGNRGGFGGVLQADGAIRSVLITGGANVSYNTAPLSNSGDGGYGGVVYATGPVGGITMEQGSAVEHNTANVSGGAFGCGEGLESFAVGGNASFSFNRALNSGGGLVVYNGNCESITLSGAVVRNNSALGFGGVFAFVSDNQNVSRFTAENATVISGNSGSWGGVLSAQGSILSIRISGGSILAYNVARQRGDSGGFGGVFSIAGYGNGDVLVDDNSRLQYNTADRYGGVLSSNALRSLTVRGNSSLAFNRAFNSSAGGGGVYVYQNLGTIIISSSHVFNNSAGGSGGVINVGGSVKVLKCTWCQVHGNAASYGGAVRVVGNVGEAIFQGSTLHSNRAEHRETEDQDTVGGYGGVLDCKGRLGRLSFVEESNISYNFAAERGGVVHIWDGLDVLTCDNGSVLSYNRATDSHGGAIAVWGNATYVTLAGGCQVVGNSAGSYGGAVYVGNGEVKVLDIVGGSLVARNTARFGGFSLVDKGVGDLNIVSSNIVDNSAAGRGDGTASGESGGSGGVLYSVGPLRAFTVSGRSNVTGNMAALDGGVAYVDDPLGNFSVVGGSTVAYNKATGGRGGVLAVDSYAGALTVAGESRVLGNTAGADGGFASVIGTTTSFTLTGLSVMDLNVATLGHGGALSCGWGLSSIVISNGSSMSQNRAGLDGGAIRSGHYWYWRIRLPAVFQVNSSSIASNTAGRSGGVWSQLGDVGDVSLVNCRLSRNTAVSGRGGALDVRGSVHRVVVRDGSSVLGNRAGVTGGFLSVSSPDTLTGAVLRNLTIRDGSSVVSNTAGQLGGAASAPLVASLTLTGGSSLSNNSATGGAGGAIAEQAAVVSAISSCSGNCLGAVPYCCL